MRIQVEIMAGPDLDRRVAEAVYTLRTGGTWKILPKFSTDLNAAFAAAEKVRLFRIDAWLCQRPFGEKEWGVWFEQKGKLRYECWAHGRTPALAICAAILELAENKKRKPKRKKA